MRKRPSTSGPAVHAYFHFHKHDGRHPHTVPLVELRKYLKGRPDRADMPDLTDLFLKQVKFCWEYLHDFISLADEYYFEPQLRGETPDIMAAHRRRFYVVEVKTIRPRPEVKTGVSHGTRQVKAGMRFLKQKTAGLVEIYGYVLAFVFQDNEAPPHVIWKEIDHFVPCPSA